MVLYSDNRVVATLNEYPSDVNVLNFEIGDECNKFYYYYLLPKFFNPSVLSYLLSRLDCYDFHELISNLFDEIDCGTAYEYSEACYQDFCEVMEDLRKFYESEGYQYG